MECRTVWEAEERAARCVDAEGYLERRMGRRSKDVAVKRVHWW